jgi:P-type E1-E2 ATPase
LAFLGDRCKAVVCCRLLPIQKAEVVLLVRECLDKITLAIGDGANDVPMIKTAHIGIGLFGEEGMGAVQAGDYALPEFRMLWRLLFVHGRWNYIRISEMILYFFYKNMLFTLPQFITAAFNGFSGQTIFDDLYIAFYNLVFTSLPLVIRAVFEQDVYYVRPSKG